MAWAADHTYEVAVVTGESAGVISPSLGGQTHAPSPRSSKDPGDQSTAWASLAADSGEQWLETTYANAVDIAQVRVLENNSPGAVVKIVAILDGGTEVPIWEGEEALLPAPADQLFPARARVVAAKVRVYLDTSKVPGWNEIDAVELVGRDGSRQWAVSASASSTYAEPAGVRYSDSDVESGENVSSAARERYTVRLRWHGLSNQL